MTVKDINQKIQDIQTALSANPDGRAKELLEQGLQTFQSLLLAEQKKSESQPVGKTGQLPKTPIRDAAAKVPQETKDEVEAWAEKVEYEEIQDPSYTSEYVRFEKEYFEKTPLKIIKAPVIDREPEYINIELTDQKGEKYIRTYNRAQTKALCRKYFSNVHNAWVGGNRKLTNGFDNLVAYFLGWVEFDGSTPGLQDVLQDYFRYKKAKEGMEDSEAFKVAKELYDKIISVLPQ